MTDDYMIFGLGHEGNIKEDEPGLHQIDVVTAAHMLSTYSSEPVEYRKTEFKSFNVVRHEYKDGKYYNVAFDIMPSRERVELAIMKYAPRPASII